jgi:hypothetical protein
MTSEVLMLNKDAVVVAADSAVTTGRDPHPRYSKAANKIFDLSIHGNVAVTIFAAAEIDRVPWELVLKQFRKHDSKSKQLPKLEDYVAALVTYLERNPSLYPDALRSDLLKKRFFRAANFVLTKIGGQSPDFIDDSKTPAERAAAWASGVAAVAQELGTLPYHGSLAQIDHQNILAQSPLLQSELAPEIAASNEYLHADVAQLTELAIESLVKQPTEFNGYTGLVFAGYGADEIFPSYVHIEIYGHIGETLLWKRVNGYAITHDNDAFILPFAQSSMIDRFTDGFDSTLNRIIYKESMDSYKQIISDLVASGIAIPSAVSDSIIAKRQPEFMKAWIRKNWELNFHPLRRVLNSLSVSEMGHLAESLLVLEELRERVTSPSESVGGPIDVVVVTKAEGLLWIKRKHFFDPQLNSRYKNRLEVDYN